MVGVCVICHWQPTVTTDRQHLAMLRLLDNMLRLGDCWTTSLHCPAAVALIVTLCGNMSQGCWTTLLLLDNISTVLLLLLSSSQSVEI